MIPFRKKYYYKPEMKGSYSIKAVLPAVVPDLKYNGLTISDGGMAMKVFEQLQYETDQDKIIETRRNLLEYFNRGMHFNPVRCMHDTVMHFYTPHIFRDGRHKIRR